MLAIRPQSTRLTVFADFEVASAPSEVSIAGSVKVLTGRDNAMSASTAHEIGVVLAYIDGFMIIGFAAVGALLLMLLLPTPPATGLLGNTIAHS